MNDKKMDNLDNWLQKNVSNSSSNENNPRKRFSRTSSQSQNMGNTRSSSSSQNSRISRTLSQNSETPKDSSRSQNSGFSRNRNQSTTKSSEKKQFSSSQISQNNNTNSSQSGKRPSVHSRILANKSTHTHQNNSKNITRKSPQRSQHSKLASSQSSGKTIQTQNIRRQAPKSPYQNKVRFIPLGGLNEVGKNMMAIEYGNDIIIIDMGLQFPEEDMLGVDYVVPDITYLKNNLHKIRGVIITHGHLDHIGGIAYMAPQLNNPPFFSLKLTNGFIKKQISEYQSCKSIKLITVKPRQKFKLGVFTINFFRVNHSIPDSTGVIIESPEGLIVHTGDFKFDPTPADGIPADMETIRWLGTQNVLALFSDSTNATKPGYAISEKVVGDTLDKIIRDTDGRLIIASFSSLIGRMQNIIDSAKKYNRQVFVSGRSMVNNLAIATKLGYLKYPKDLVKQLNRAKKEALKKNALIITTGSQGESMSALTRMALNEHKHVKINSKDTIVFSSNPIMGNERGVIAVTNELSKKGAKVINNSIMDVHTTGHGYQEDLKTMFKLVNPKYFIPVHGEYYMRKAHKDLAVEHGIPDENIFLLENGSILEAKDNKLEVSKETVPANYILIDNQTGTLSSVSYQILSERQAMAANGIILIDISIDKRTYVLKSAKVKSHGFTYMRETEKILEAIQKSIIKQYQHYMNTNKKVDFASLETLFRTSTYKVITDKIERRPFVSTVVNTI